MNKNKLLLAILISMTLAGCGIIQKNEKIKIGAILPLTGNLSQYAQEVQQGMGLALKNESLPVDILYEDSKSETKPAVDAFYKLSADGASIMITGNSNASLAISPLANEYAVLQMALFSSAAKYTSPDDFTFQVTPRSEIENSIMADWVNTSQAKQIAFIYSQDEWGLGHYDFLHEKINKEKTKISASETYLPADTDFRTQLNKIRNTNPEIIFIIAKSKTAGLILKQAKELKINTQFLGVRAIEGNDLISIGGDMAEGIIYPYSFNPENTSEQIKQFVDTYKKLYSKIPTAYVAEGYDATKLLIGAVKQCGSKNTSCFKQYLTGIKEYPGVLGSISFDKNGDVYLPIFLKTVKDGQFVPYK